MSNTSKNRLFIAIALLAILLIGGFFLFNDKNTGGVEDEDVSEVRGDEMTVSGVITCLPYNVNIAGQECVKGLRGDDGKMYALNVVTPIPEGTKVTAIGVYQAANTSVDDSNVFRYDGVLVVRTLQRK